MIKALVDLKMDQKNIERIKEVPGYEFIIAKDKEEMEKYIKECQVYISFAPKEKYIEMGKNLKWVAALSAGVDHIPLNLIKNRNIILTNGSGIHKTHMAEYTISMMTALSRNFSSIEKNNRKKIWDADIIQDQIFGKTVGILGLGSIGSEIAKYSKLLGMRVIGVKRNISNMEYVDKVYGQNEMEKVLSRSDFVVNVLPFTAETHKLIDYKYLSKMKNDSYYINIGRGKTTDEEDLIRALKEGKIKGAALDVFYNEPLPKDSPLWDMENVIITPHISGVSKVYMDKALNILLPNLVSYRDDMRLDNIVNLETGY
ncbi:MAG: D-2-hydroxyacid dehydrogenase [Bacillota bacterium]|nr:D-2-hydroxyacid dehydrogenase [Bacillota bacterium]